MAHVSTLVWARSGSHTHSAVVPAIEAGVVDRLLEARLDELLAARVAGVELDGIEARQLGDEMRRRRLADARRA